MPNARFPRDNMDATSDPGTGDDEDDFYGYYSRWVNTNTDTLFICTDPTAGAAVWEEATGGGVAGAVGSTDNAILRADVGAGEIQGSDLTISDKASNIVQVQPTSSGSNGTLLRLWGGAPTGSNDGGSIQLFGTNGGSSGDGGFVQPRGGESGSSSGDAGDIIINGGVSNNSNAAGDVVITGGDGDDTGTAGGIFILGGDGNFSGTAAPGSILIRGGSDSGFSNPGGQVIIDSGSGSTGAAIQIGPSNATVVTIGNGSSSLSFFGGGAVPKQTVSGSKGGNAALASLMTAFSNYNLVTDSTT